MSRKYKVLDLFSGIGGFSLALKSIATTVAYCDIDISCRAVLENNISKRLLEPAPIFTDVTKLTASHIAKFKPNMITAGFPCTDISSANPNGKGLKGEHSGLYREIIRLIDELGTIDTVFMENSPRIVDKGFAYVKRTMQARGFLVRYCIVEAKDVGALHKRKRWYCLCTKSNTSILPIIDIKYIKNNWVGVYKHDKIKYIKKTLFKKQVETRCGMLGNSIVPQCAMYAWNLLVNPDVRMNIQRSPAQNLILSDGLVTVKRNYWATPTRSIWYQYRSLTHRGIGILSNQLYYTEDTIIKEDYNTDKKLHSHEYISNPVFVELLMGYPKNWTKTSSV